MSGLNTLPQYMAYLDERGIIPASFWGEGGIENFVTPEKSRTAHTLSTTGIYNRIYGGALVEQILYSDNWLSILPKVPYEKSGHRVVEAVGMSTGVGSALGGALKTATPPTYSQELYTTPALQTNTVDINLENEALAGKDDIVTPQEIVAWGMTEFRNGIDYALGLDTDTLASAGTYMESVDRMINSTALAVTNHSYTAADEDFMAVDRSANTWFASQYNDNANTDRVFQLSYLESVLAACEPYASGPGGYNLVCATGFDTAWRINQAAGPAIFHTKEDFALGINGVSTQKGTAYNIKVNSIHGYPLVPLRTHVAADTLSRIYVYNQDFCGIKMLIPPATMKSSDPIVVGNFLHRYVNFMYGQLYSTKSKAHGAVWDLK